MKNNEKYTKQKLLWQNQFTWDAYSVPELKKNENRCTTLL